MTDIPTLHPRTYHTHTHTHTNLLYHENSLNAGQAESVKKIVGTVSGQSHYYTPIFLWVG